MKRSQREAAARGSTHLLRLSLPAVRSNGSFEGADILAEAAAVPAVLLCQVYRSVMTWALTPSAEHPGLFPAGAAEESRRLLEASTVPAELRPAVEAACELLSDPAAADPQRLAEACARIGDWAEQRGDAPATALRFMQAAATCSPNDGRVAYRAGRIARQRASWDVAELWFRHSSTVGRRAHDWEAHAMAYVGLGNSYYQQGRYSLAKREHQKALRVGRRHGLREVQGMAYHDLLVMAVLSGDPSAESFAQRAYHAYGPRHANIPALAHDIAYYWHTHGHFARALRVFRAVLPNFSDPERRLIVLGSIGREGGECGLREVFFAAWSELWQIAPNLEGVSTLPPSLIQLALGAVRLGEQSLAQQAVERALSLARSRGEADVVAEAERLLAGSMLAPAVTPPGKTLSTAVSTGSADEADALADSLVSSLEVISAG